MEETYRGLSTARDREFLKKTGPNAISEREESLRSRLAKKFRAPVPWMFEISIVLEAVLGKWIESLIILAVLVFNAMLRITQELRAKSALDLLRNSWKSVRGIGETECGS
ncbi:MAG: hypothetical protein EPN30_08045 [Actinomycetota bacterium]|nr:MAG: hypothetical protein EPN30_08045 [Actinomycetota bacterium]